MANADIIAVPAPIDEDNPTDGAAAIPSISTAPSSRPSSINPVTDAIVDESNDGGEDIEPVSMP